MAVVVNWRGDVIVPSDPNKEWSTKGGIFNSAKKVKTYFPLPTAYRNAVSSVGIHTVTADQAYRPDLIAKLLYGSEDYWWLIYWMTGVIDPFSGPKPNDIVVIANINDVINLLG